MRRSRISVLVAVACLGWSQPVAAATSPALPIVFATLDGKLVRVNPDGSGRAVIAADPKRYWQYRAPDVSPDGRRVAFAYCDPGIGHPDPPCLLGIVNINGTDLRVLEDVKGVSTPRWSPDGRRIAYGTLHDVMVVNCDGSGGSRVASGHGPEWLADGVTLVFWEYKEVDNPDRNDSGGEILGAALYTVRADGSEAPRQLGPDFKEDVGQLTVSPDGRRLAFLVEAHSPNESSTIALMNVDGSDIRPFRQRSDGSYRLGRPAWSPDGRQIAHAEADSEGHWTTIVIDDLATARTTIVEKGPGLWTAWANPGTPDESGGLTDPWNLGSCRSTSAGPGPWSGMAGR